MKVRYFLAVVVKHKGKLYKVNTVSVGSDLSIYIFNNLGVKSAAVKGSYHKSGVRHFTSENSGEGKNYFFRKIKTSHEQIDGGNGLQKMTIKNINKIDFSKQKEFIPSRKYSHILEIKASKYIHLGLMYFLSKAHFNINNLPSFYDEVFSYDFQDYKLIVTTKNLTTPMHIFYFWRVSN